MAVATVIVATSSLVALSCLAQANEQNCPIAEQQIPREKLHLYLLVGQSNMSGRGRLTPEDRLTTPKVYSLDKNNRWLAASHPLHFDKPKIAGVGLGIDFAEQMLKSDQSIRVGLIPCAVGGTSLEEWSKGGKLYEAALTRTKLAEEVGTLRGVLWHQGEADCGIKSASTYGERLTRLISDLRGDLNKPSLPFVLGELGEFRVGVKRRSDIVIQQQQAIPETVANTACVSAKGLGHNGDYSHFDAKSLREFGVRYAAAMESLQSRGD